MSARTTVIVWALLGASCGGAGALDEVAETGVPNDGAIEDAALEDLDGAVLARRAVSSEARVASAAIEALRARGPAGLEALMRQHAQAIAQMRSLPNEPPEGGPEARARLRHALDTVAAQRDAHASGLYWYTDLEQAKRAARARGVPIVSLRLLGDLDEEMSCANSRYFRVLLYSDPTVADALREGFVLHWSSERPVPRVRIDMGDGRTLERTLTGNSAHYVLDSEGRPIDVLVGLDSPSGFVRSLRAARALVERCGERMESACLSRAHAERGRAMQGWWRSSTARLSWGDAIASLPGAPPQAAPRAAQAMRLTVGKSGREMPLLIALGDRPAAPPAEPDWASVALSTGTLRAMHPWTLALLRLKGDRDDVTATAQGLRRTAAADGVRNELLFHRRVHEWFAARRPETASFEALNEAVYRELMLTPASDPWLGLDADGLEDAIEPAR